jgi:hypothetical protein
MLTTMLVSMSCLFYAVGPSNYEYGIERLRAL